MISGVSRITFPTVHDARGNLSFIENGTHIPYDIKRVYYLYDVPSGSERGGHAHHELKQVLISLSGSFEVHLDNGVEKETVLLNKPNEGLLIDTMVWRTIDNFSSGSVCLVLASDIYCEEEYIREYDDFLQEVIT